MPRQISPNNQGQTPGYSLVRPVRYGGTGQNNPVDATKTLGFIGNKEINVPNGAVELGVDGRIPASFFPSSLLNQINPTISGPLSLTYGQTATYTITNYVSTDIYSVTSIAGTASITAGVITYTAPNSTGTYGFIVNGITVSVQVAQEVVAIAGPSSLNENQVATYTISNYNSSIPYTVSPIQGVVSISTNTITYTAPAGNGINSINAGFIINGTSVPVLINPPPTPTVSGPTSLALTAVGTYTITNYQTGSTYNISATSGTVTASGATITYTAPNTTGVFGFIINGVSIAVNVVLPTIQTPSIQSPTNGTTNLSASVTFTATPFSMTAGIDTQQASNWQIASDAAFNNIVQVSSNDTVNLTSWTANNLMANSTFYVRVQYIGKSSELSIYSNGISFSTKVAYVPTAITTTVSPTISYPGSFGYSISINGDGTVVAVGDTTDTNGDGGATYIFTKVGGTWSQTMKFYANPVNNTSPYSYQNSIQGSSVALNSAGTVLAIGAFNDFTNQTTHDNSGLGFVATLTGGAWSIAQSITGGTDTNGFFGNSCAIDAAGDTIIMCAYNENNGIGAAYIYTLSNGTWTKTARLVSPAAGGNFGYECAMNAAGTMVAITCSGDNAVYVYTLSAGVWSVTGTLSSGQTGTAFASSVAMNGTGSIVAVGSANEGSSGTGGVYIYTLTGSTWAQSANIPGVTTTSNFGMNVTLDQIGEVLVVGAPSTNNYTGAIYSYKYSAGVWTLIGTINAPQTGVSFGQTFALNGTGTTAAIGLYMGSQSPSRFYIAS